MFKKLKLERFCCCCTLQTGSLIIGTLGWLATLFQLFYLTNPLKQEANPYKNPELDIAAEISYGIITLIVCVMMIYGVYKNNNRFVLPWLVLKCLECIAWTIITVIIFVLFFVVKNIPVMIALFLIIIFASTLNWYFWICVWSLYIDLNDDEQSMSINSIKDKENNIYPVADV